MKISRILSLPLALFLALLQFSCFFKEYDYYEKDVKLYDSPGIEFNQVKLSYLLDYDVSCKTFFDSETYDSLIVKGRFAFGIEYSRNSDFSDSTAVAFRYKEYSDSHYYGFGRLKLNEGNTTYYLRPFLAMLDTSNGVNYSGYGYSYVISPYRVICYGNPVECKTLVVSQ
jgi:hypothetical protein